jgi:hypothetical protein
LITAGRSRPRSSDTHGITSRLPTRFIIGAFSCRWRYAQDPYRRITVGLAVARIDRPLPCRRRAGRLGDLLAFVEGAEHDDAAPVAVEWLAERGGEHRQLGKVLTAPFGELFAASSETAALGSNRRQMAGHDR